MPTDTVSNKKSSEIHNYWIEMYWPHADRDLSKLPVWFHAKKIKKDQIIKDGDLVLFYEVRHNPSSSYLGARTIFASGEVLSDKQNIPAEQQLRGGKKWLFTRATRPRFSVLPTQGISLKKVKTILKIKGWPQQGFRIAKEEFEKIENELKTKLDGHKPEKSREKGQSNDPWRREELILALELYFDCDPFKISASDDKVLALSKVLNSLPFNRAKRDNSLFRNPNGVKMKLLNFVRLDPKYESRGKGLSKGSKLEVAVWDEYAGNRVALKKMSELIRQSIEADLPDDDNEEESFFEGQLLKRMHLSRERNRKVILKAKARALKRGPLTCEVCKFTYIKRYGSIGENFIEAHHTVPISEYLERRETKVEDIALLCANCHRMIHKRRPWLTTKELKAMLLET